MREIPLLMNGPMVRATLAGHKTVTRRTNGLEYFSDNEPDNWRCVRVVGGYAYFVYGNSPVERAEKCPYGQVGDRLWVRETWAPDPPADGTWAYTSWAGCKGSKLMDIPERYRKPAHCMFAADYPHDAKRWVWKPSIHMPRWACRILLEVSGVRVERLQDISERDAVAEGVTAFYCGPAHDVKNPTRWGVEKTPLHESPTDAFCYLWEGISGAGSWDANPWVWVIEFRRAK